jgi:hypothetical protein
MTRYEDLDHKIHSLESAAWRAPYLMSLMWLKKKKELEKIRDRLTLGQAESPSLGGKAWMKPRKW